MLQIFRFVSLAEVQLNGENCFFIVLFFEAIETPSWNSEEK